MRPLLAGVLHLLFESSVFGGEMAMSVSLLNKIFGKFTLGQQSIGGDGCASNIYTIEEWDGGLDFVRLFFFVAAFYRQDADFFWVWLCLL